MVEALINNFSNYLAYEKRFSVHTSKAYISDLEQFQSYLNTRYNIANIEEVNHQIIRSWIVELLEQKLTSRSVNRKISSLKKFYKYLIKNGLIKKNPMLKIISPKTSKRLPVFVEQDKMENLFEKISFESSFKSLRDKSILELFYGTGMRLSELCSLKTSDVNIYNSQVKVLGKRNKERIIPLTNNLIKVLNEYMEVRKEVANNIDYLFLTEKGGKIYEKLVYRIVIYYLSKITTIDKKSPHVLRHTFATHMLNNGAELNAIKEFLGHANLSATQVYTHNTVEKLKRIYKQAHPKA